MGETDRYEVLDEHGHKTDALLELEAIHKQELWHEVVNVWIVNFKGDILMQLRGPKVDLAPNVWDVAIGSHLLPGENPPDAAIRALKNGLGLTVDPGELKHLFNIMCANPMPDNTVHKVMGHVFLVQRDLDFGKMTYDKHKIVKFAWVQPLILMSEIGSEETKPRYFPRANNYYPKLFESFQAWMYPGNTEP
jgi:isopentenyldiphosphate isomerase